MILNIGGNTIATSYHGCITKLINAKIVEACPHDTDAYRATARQLGYKDNTLRMCQDHEVTHTALSVMLGLNESITLRRVADGMPSDNLTDLEEAAVLAIQRFANAAGINILSAVKRSMCDV